MADRDPDLPASDRDASPSGEDGASEALSRPLGDRREPVVPERRDADEVRRARGTPSGSGSSFLRELPVLLLVAFVLAFLLRTFVVQVFYIPSASMEPTLMVDDRMVVEKVTYLFREPERGEIVVFEGENGSSEPEGSAVSQAVRGVGQFLGVVPASARDFVKRVIGLPGDEVLITSGQVSVNGVALDEPYAVDEDADYGPIIVPEGRLFFLGDNRPNSSDSRRSLGFVDRDAVVGRAVVTIFPLSDAGLLIGVEHDEVPAPDNPAPPADDVPDADEVGEG